VYDTAFRSGCLCADSFIPSSVGHPNTKGQFDGYRFVSVAFVRSGKVTERRGQIEKGLTSLGESSDK
jgi:hypothetical protein